MALVCNGLASGPESKSRLMINGPPGCDSGTRTEAGQKVPHEKPEWAVARALPSVVISVMRAPKISWTAGETGLPQ
jgi:hypothetical protein